MNSVSFVDGEMFADNKKEIGGFMEYILKVTGDERRSLLYSTK